ncbi:AAA-ATPase [Prunus yedoensis var. nudiflora]|uniref:AAA-ATPase n=1 Tax=Prunus yedoensis var. nudiflora TaxID=2094558 RepID=A0A314YAM9_PRUYE|nr:AAA-ATPase [Prunus yedoensis var. nudiflora]
MVKMGELWTQLGSVMASMMFAYAMVKQFFPDNLGNILEKYTQKLVGYVYPYIQISFDEYTVEFFRRSEVYSSIQSYLSTKSSTRAKRLKAHDVKGSKALVLGMDDNEEVTDEFQGIKLWDIVMGSYLDHVRQEGKAIAVSNRQRKLYINNTGKGAKWSHVVFEHPATFETLAMDPKEKQAIINDLMKFSKGKDYYKKIGKAWKRGYLLYGPPGTGKSTMISAMSNLMNYDVYDLELTAVKDNTELRKLLIDITGKAIIVIEDIDCSLDLTGQRKKKKQEEEKDGDEKDPIPKRPEEEETTTSKVTLSGLLNFIDGIWSACGGERLIVFTTNYVDKLDPALIRRGRMDKHIQLSYCCFGAFKVLARNYLDVESHELFGTIERLLGETDMTPADVAENLMLKSDTEDADSCLKSLIEALEAAKVEVRVKAEEEAKLKAEKEEKEKEESGNSNHEVKCNGTIDKVKGTSVAEVKENGVTP